MAQQFSYLEQEIVDLEKKLEHSINTAFNQDPGDALKYFDTVKMRFFDAMPHEGGHFGGLEIPSENFVPHWYEIAPKFVGIIQFMALQPHACGDVGFVSMIQFYRGRTREGQEFEMALRATDGLRKQNGEWKIVHEHLSFPVDLETREAKLRLWRP